MSFDNPLDVKFIFAVEELEAWYLGDRDALLRYNPAIREDILDEYEQDSICGTWELLAKADGLVINQKRSRHAADRKKLWSKKIPPYMEVEQNCSPSFHIFVDALQQSAEGT